MKRTLILSTALLIFAQPLLASASQTDCDQDKIDLLQENQRVGTLYSRIGAVSFVTGFITAVVANTNGNSKIEGVGRTLAVGGGLTEILGIAGNKLATRALDKCLAELPAPVASTDPAKTVLATQPSGVTLKTLADASKGN